MFAGDLGRFQSFRKGAPRSRAGLWQPVKRRRGGLVILTSPQSPLLKKIRKAISQGTLTEDGLAGCLLAAIYGLRRRCSR